MMLVLTKILIVLLSGLTHPAVSDSVQDNWVVPDGSQRDLYETFYKGHTVDIRWVGWIPDATAQYLGTNIADLWVTSWHWSEAQYLELLSKNHNISESGRVSWTVNIDVASLAKTNRYVLRFMVPGTAYESDAKQISSPGFLVLDESTTSSTTSSTTASTTTPTTTPTTTSTSPPSTSATTMITSSTSISTSSTTGLSVGAKAGIGVGAAVGGIALLAAVAFLIRRRRRNQIASREANYHISPTERPFEDHGYTEPKPIYPQELQSLPAELGPR